MVLDANTVRYVKKKYDEGNNAYFSFVHMEMVPGFYTVDDQNIQRPATDQEVARDLNIYRVIEDYPDFDDKLKKVVVSPTPEWNIDEDNGVIIKTYTIIDKSFSEIKLDLLSKLPVIRYEKETMGYEIGGYKFSTDRQSQALLNSAYNLIKLDNDKIINWKCLDDKFIMLNNSIIDIIVNLIGNYIEECFTNEMRIYQLIQNVEEGSINTLIPMYDELENGWPIPSSETNIGNSE